MELKNILSVSGLPGLFKLVANRSNGLMIEDLDTGKIRFASVRRYQFTPLESIGLFTDDDTISINDVFEKMLRTEQEIPPHNASNQEIKSFFEMIIPEYDRERVFIKDMKKVLKWYDFLNSKAMLSLSDEEE